MTGHDLEVFSSTLGRARLRRMSRWWRSRSSEEGTGGVEGEEVGLWWKRLFCTGSGK